MEHVAQEDGWDCGAACALMILKWSKNHNISLSELKALKGWSRPLWTIDIYCLLMEFGVDCRFMTKCIGTGPHHKDLAWYSDDMEEDSVRVPCMFELASSQQWSVEE
ncbi:GC1, partial [Symbiodinium microadriaticum]